MLVIATECAIEWTFYWTLSDCLSSCIICDLDLQYGPYLMPYKAMFVLWTLLLWWLLFANGETLRARTGTALQYHWSAEAMVCGSYGISFAAVHGNYMVCLFLWSTDVWSSGVLAECSISSILTVWKNPYVLQCSGLYIKTPGQTDSSRTINNWFFLTSRLGVQTRGASSVQYRMNVSTQYNIMRIMFNCSSHRVHQECNIKCSLYTQTVLYALRHLCIMFI